MATSNLYAQLDEYLTENDGMERHLAMLMQLGGTIDFRNRLGAVVIRTCGKDTAECALLALRLLSEETSRTAGLRHARKGSPYQRTDFLYSIVAAPHHMVVVGDAVGMIPADPIEQAHVLLPAMSIRLIARFGRFVDVTTSVTVCEHNDVDLTAGAREARD